MRDKFIRRDLLADENFVSYVGIPLVIKGKIKGVLEIFHRSPLKPAPGWIKFLETLAGQAAIAIDNSQLFQDVQRTNSELIVAYDATIEGWVSALDLRYKESKGHSERVTRMTLQLARLMGIRDEKLIHIRRGALLHDIGKMVVPDHVLMNTGELSPGHQELIRRHPQYAYDILSPIHYLKEALEIPYCHHERWNGTGYPRGLKEEQIPLSARIFGVVDTWDSLTSDRPYRAAWSKSNALDYIVKHSGIYFDPRVVEVFLKYLGDMEAA
jgi:HD-GYP domain-containing protein (c-di-GMP phosphodiesterase class II)